MFGPELAFLNSYFAVVAFLFGAIIGSFLNVVIYRFHTGKSLSGHSHCLSCQHQLRWYELFPVVSYLALRGKCSTCSSYIPIRYTLVELLSAFGFLAIYLKGGSLLVMALTGILFAFLLVVAVYDFYHFVIPDDLVIAIGVIVALFYGVFFYQGMGILEIWYSVTSGAAAAAFFALLWKLSNGRWIGFGDVKLAVPLGILAGTAGAFSMVVLSFWVGAAVSLVIIGIQKSVKRGKIRLPFIDAHLTMKSEVPFAPFLIAGFVLSYFYGVDVLELMRYVL